jgi:cysteine-rich repeat protein
MLASLGRFLPLSLVLSLVGCAVAAEDEAVLSSEARAESVACGNGVRDEGESCDDGNTSSNDGCSKTCAFEQVQRMNAIDMLFKKDAFCTANALGGAVGGVAQADIKKALSDAVADGSVSILLSFDGLEDPSGKKADALKVTSLVGAPKAGSKGGLDSVYTPTKASASANLILPGKIEESALSLGPGKMGFAMQLGAEPTSVVLRDARLKAKIGAASTPGGHLPGERLDPALQSFATMTDGQLCGDIDAATLASIPAPKELQGGTCNQGYTAANSMLDVFVGGCTAFIISALAATQPDRGGYRLMTSAGRKVTGCTDKAGAKVALEKCLEEAAYSSAFKFTTERVVLR